MKIAIQRLGAQRVRRNLPQEDCLLIQSMTPANPTVAQITQKEFLKNAVTVFESDYYLSDPNDPEEDSFWYLRDMQNDDAPHVPVTLYSSEQVAFYTDIGVLIKYGLSSPDYRNFEHRIVVQFPKVSKL